jgi:hypothetical protein
VLPAFPSWALRRRIDRVAGVPPSRLPNSELGTLRSELRVPSSYRTLKSTNSPDRCTFSRLPIFLGSCNLSEITDIPDHTTAEASLRTVLLALFRERWEGRRCRFRVVASTS